MRFSVEGTSLCYRPDAVARKREADSFVPDPSSPPQRLLGIVHASSDAERVQSLRIRDVERILDHHNAVWEAPKSAVLRKLKAFRPSDAPSEGQEEEVMHPWFMSQVAVLFGTAVRDGHVFSIRHTHNVPSLFHSRPDVLRYLDEGSFISPNIVCAVELKLKGNITDGGRLQACKYGTQILLAQPFRRLAYVALSDGVDMEVFRFEYANLESINIARQHARLDTASGQKLLHALLTNPPAALGFSSPGAFTCRNPR